MCRPHSIVCEAFDLHVTETDDTLLNPSGFRFVKNFEPLRFISLGTNKGRNQ